MPFMGFGAESGAPRRSTTLNPVQAVTMQNRSTPRYNCAIKGSKGASVPQRRAAIPLRWQLFPLGSHVIRVGGKNNSFDSPPNRKFFEQSARGRSEVFRPGPSRCGHVPGPPRPLPARHGIFHLQPLGVLEDPKEAQPGNTPHGIVPRFYPPLLLCSNFFFL